MPFPPTLREWGLQAEVSYILAKTSMEGDLDVRDRQLDDGLCSLTKEADVQPHRGRCSFSEGSPL